MKKLVSLLLLMLFSTMVLAADYPQHDPHRILTVSENPSGQKTYGLDLRYLDRMLSDLSRHAGTYPPRFNSVEQKQRVIQDLSTLSGMLELLLKSGQPNTQILFRAAVANRMGHNLDIPNTAKRAEELFQILLQIDPDTPQGNYQFGLFLAETTRIERSIPYLEKALSLGIDRAHYSLGMAYLGMGDSKQALVRLKEHLRNHPDDETKKVIEAIETGQHINAKG